MPNQWKAGLYCALAMLMVGSTVVASKFIGAGLPPFTATCLRFLLALPLFVLLMRLGGARWPRPGRRDAALLLLQAAAGSVGYSVLLIAGVGLTSGVDAGIIAGSLPAASALFAMLALGERPRLRLLLAIGLATAGVLVVSLRPGAEGDAADLPQRWLGNALILAAVACESVFILLNKKLRAPVPALPLSGLMAAGGLLLSLPFALMEAPWLLIADAASPALRAALLGVAYYALVPTVAGFVLWYAGASRTSGARAALFTALLPVSALALSALLLGEHITALQATGTACVLIAVLLVAAEPRPAAARG
jgi:drug/metabolite transporter (DMT)-like permease